MQKWSYILYFACVVDDMWIGKIVSECRKVWVEIKQPGTGEL